MRCQETKDSVAVNVRILRQAALDGERGRRRRCCGREDLRDKEGGGGDEMSRDETFCG